uniref:17-beta-hydroxysteroid dehydrogenase 14-like n=1 Tax=Phallusia mammillata TaxID=59560 RepID=A0A6F9DER7_9ASCI|nr:17-beta-hydroxysteroid dehydrogenase 14-like [Phallusia mammillata]
MMKFEGKAVVVTGASSGIGAEVAVAFAKEGASLCITGRNEENLNKVSEECLNNGSPKVVKVIADLGQIESCKLIISKAMEELNQIDVLVNNAGFLHIANLESTTLEQYDAMFNINVKAVFHLTQLAIPYLKKTKGSIVNVSSCVSTMLFPHYLAYGMGKAALDYFTRCTALELAPSGVRVNAVNPGSVRTKIHEKRFSADKLDEYYQHMGTQHPLGKLVETSDVANAVLFLASDASAMVTGTCLFVDGGLSLKSA